MELAGTPFQSEVELRAGGWLFCLSDHQLGPQYLSLAFLIFHVTKYHSCYLISLMSGYQDKIIVDQSSPKSHDGPWRKHQGSYSRRVVAGAALERCCQEPRMTGEGGGGRKAPLLEPLEGAWLADTPLKFQLLEA